MEHRQDWRGLKEELERADLSDDERYVRRLAFRQTLAARLAAEREGWPSYIVPVERREAHIKEKMKGRRYDEPDQIVLETTERHPVFVPRASVEQQ